jgi:hypothetical protein
MIKKIITWLVFTLGLVPPLWLGYHWVTTLRYGYDYTWIHVIFFACGLFVFWGILVMAANLIYPITKGFADVIKDIPVEPAEVICSGRSSGVAPTIAN